MYTMKKIIYLLFFAQVLVFMACTTDAGYDPSSRYKNKHVDYITERSNHMPKCNDDLEGYVFYVENEFMVYSCIDGVWTEGRKIPIGAVELEDVPRYNASTFGTDIKNAEKDLKNEYETSSFIDLRDGNVYSTVIIDGMEWMTENLNYDVDENSAFVSSCIEKFGEKNCRVYLGYTRNEGYQMFLESVCPEDFEIPSRYKWERLFAAIGDENVAQFLKDKSFPSSEKYPAKDLISFGALPTGYYILSDITCLADDEDCDPVIESDVGNAAVFWMGFDGAVKFTSNSNTAVFSNLYGYASVRCMRVL